MSGLETGNRVERHVTAAETGSRRSENLKMVAIAVAWSQGVSPGRFLSWDLSLWACWRLRLLRPSIFEAQCLHLSLNKCLIASLVVFFFLWWFYRTFRDKKKMILWDDHVWVETTYWMDKFNYDGSFTNCTMISSFGWLIWDWIRNRIMSSREQNTNM